VVLAALLTHPDLLVEFEPDLERLDCQAPEHQTIRAALLRHADNTPDVLREKIITDIGPAPLEKLLGQSHIRIVPAIRNPADTDQARTCIAEELAKLDAKRGAAREIDEAVQDIAELADEGLTWRLGQAAEARARAEHGETEDKTQYDTAPSGAKMDREERGAFHSLLDQIQFSKPRRR